MDFMTLFFRNCSWLVTRPGLFAGGFVGGFTMPSTGSSCSSSRGAGAPPPPPFVVLDDASPFDTPSDILEDMSVPKALLPTSKLTTEPTKCSPFCWEDAR